jgi:UDP-GlcNAc:undecaprenyl-phosphate GlcNAc-1-phosphate transferase
MLGLSERRAVYWLYVITLWFGLLALWGSTARNPLFTIAITVVSAIALVVLGIFLAEVQTYSEEEFENARKSLSEKTVLSRVFMHKRHFVEAFMDFSLICACWILAFILRFDGQIGTHTRELGITLPYVAAAQMVSFYICGQYRGLWRYLTVSDVSHAFSGVILGTFTAGILLRIFEPTGTFSFSVVAIYGALLLITVIGIRASLKTLRFHFATQWRDNHKRAIVVGAGDAGELAVREMLHNKALNLQPVGFLDDDPAKQRARIHGIRVLGTRDELLKYVDKLNVDEVIIAMPSIGNGVVQEIVEMCQQNGIAHREVRGVIF